MAPTDQHWQACKKVLRYLKGTSTYGLCFQPAAELFVEAFTDADWASCVDDRRSTSGCCVYIGSNLITWFSRKQKVVAKSSAEAEYRALSQAASEVLWLKSLFAEMGYPILGVPTIWCDNTGAASLAQNPVFHSRTKHVEIDIHFVREKIAAGLLSVQFEYYRQNIWQQTRGVNIQNLPIIISHGISKTT